MDTIKYAGEAFHLVPIPCKLIVTTPRKGGTQMLGYLLERNIEADINLSPDWVWGRARLGGRRQDAHDDPGRVEGGPVRIRSRLRHLHTQDGGMGEVVQSEGRVLGAVLSALI